MIELILGSFYHLDHLNGHSSSGGLQKDASLDSRKVRPKILVVDDERVIADTIYEILESAGFDVAVAYDGWEAIEKAATFKPDQLLSDVKMPHMNGVELAMTIRKIYPSMKILLFTAQLGFSELIADAERQGFQFEVLAKPVRPLDLIKRLRDQ